MPTEGRRKRVAVVCDLREENWHSMNLAAELLVEGTKGGHAFGEGIEAARLCPPMRRRLTRAGTSVGTLFNADRLLNRFWDYPRWMRRKAGEFDLFHVVDHSYAQLLHELPEGRAVVTCHDLDAFRCLLDPTNEPRSPPFRAMMRRVLAGFRKAERVACVSAATRDELLAHELFPPRRLVVIPNGIHPAFNTAPDAAAEREAPRLLGDQEEDAPELLHVGSTVGRKRIDVLLDIFARVRAEFPRARLVRVGGDFTARQRALADELGVAGSVVTLPFLDATVLAAVYRRAALVLLPSEREGFGLPLAEALACGTPVVASDLPVLREVGGDAATFCAVGDASSWAEACRELLGERARDPESWRARRDAGIRQASRFTWEEHVEKTFALYRELLA